MKKIARFFILLVTCFACQKNPEVQIKDTIIKLTIYDQTKTPVPNTKVYVFDLPPTSTVNPETALHTGNTDQNGVIEIKINDLDGTPVVYLTILEKLIDDSINILGTLEVQIPEEKPEIIARELQIEDSMLKYPYGFMPTAIHSELAKSEYNRWKSQLVVPCGDGLRVIADPSAETKVEAMGFGTILSAYANDKETFDGLMNFYNSKRTTAANNMMAWSVTCDDIDDPGSATDGDIDVAFANIVAYTRWGDTYLNKAKEIITLIKENLIVDCTVNGSPVKALAPGYSNGLWGGCQLTDIQYYTPAFFRIFADATGDEVWNTLADDAYAILNASAHPSTGLVPDWQTAEGVAGPNGWAGHFGYDACRVPYRMAIDYLWNGNIKAQQWCTKVSNWAYETGADNMVDGYELDGTPIGEYGVNSAFLGGFTVALMTNDYDKVNSFSLKFVALHDNYWFNLNTRVLYLFVLSGNFWQPKI